MNSPRIQMLCKKQKINIQRVRCFTHVVQVGKDIQTRCIYDAEVICSRRKDQLFLSLNAFNSKKKNTCRKNWGRPKSNVHIQLALLWKCKTVRRWNVLFSQLSDCFIKTWTKKFFLVLQEFYTAISSSLVKSELSCKARKYPLKWNLTS